MATVHKNIHSNGKFMSVSIIDIKDRYELDLIFKIVQRAIEMNRQYVRGIN